MSKVDPVFYILLNDGATAPFTGPVLSDTEDFEKCFSLPGGYFLFTD